MTAYCSDLRLNDDGTQYLSNYWLGSCVEFEEGWNEIDLQIRNKQKRRKDIE